MLWDKTVSYSKCARQLVPEKEHDTCLAAITTGVVIRMVSIGGICSVKIRQQHLHMAHI